MAPNAGSPEFVKLVLQGLKQPALGSRGYYSACVVHPCHVRGGVLGTALQGACRGEAWRRGGENACDRVLASRVRRSLCYPAQKEGGVALMLTKGLGWRGPQCRTAGGKLRRRSAAERAEGLKGGVSGRLGGTDRCTALL